MRILCIGDSNTWGYNPENGWRITNRWTRVLGDLCPEHEIIEEGLNGRTVNSVDPTFPERRVLSNLKVILMTHKPVDMVILMLGTNEFKKIFPATAEYVGEAIEECMEIILDKKMWDKFPVPKLLVVSPVTIRRELKVNGDVFGGFDDKSVDESERLADVLRNICEKYGVDFLDAAEYAEASLIDNIHMDEENHVKLGKALAERVKEEA